MKPNHLFTSLLGLTALLVTSCATPKLAQNSADQDDVYHTTAQAKEYKAAPVVQNNVAQNTETVDDYYGTSDPYYDMDYTSRIDRFYYGNQWRGYYDPFYNYYGYNSFYSPYNAYYGSYLGAYYNSWGFNNWGGFYGYNPYFSNFWGPYSFGGAWGGGLGWGGGFWGGGWGGGVWASRNENYRPRPDRSSYGASAAVRANGRYNGSAPATRGNVNGSTRSNVPNTYNPSNNGNNSRPTRTSSTEGRPAPQPSSRPTYTPPPSNNGGSSSGGSSGSSGGGGSRPTRGGGRG